MFDFEAIASNSENPTLITVLFTILACLLLSSMIVFTYDKTTRDVTKSSNFMQALVLITIVSATVIQAIGDSLARGLGMLGALSIIRFRTTVKNPRNIVFMFSAIATGIACGVYGFVIAFFGTVAFCTVAFLLRLSPFSPREELVGVLKIEIEKDPDLKKKVFKIIKKQSFGFSMKKFRFFNSETKQNRIAYEINIKISDEDQAFNLLNELKDLEGVQEARINFSENSGEI